MVLMCFRVYDMAMRKNTILRAVELLNGADIPVLATTPELAIMLNLNPSTIRRWASENRILAGRVNAKLFLFDVRQVLTAIVKTNPLRRSICKNPLCVSLLKNKTKTKG